MGGFDESFRFCGDTEYMARACVAGLPFRCATLRNVAAFRLRAGQLTKNLPVMQALSYCRQWLQPYFWRLAGTLWRACSSLMAVLLQVLPPI